MQKYSEAVKEILANGEVSECVRELFDEDVERYENALPLIAQKNNESHKLLFFHIISYMNITRKRPEESMFQILQMYLDWENIFFIILMGYIEYDEKDKKEWEHLICLCVERNKKLKLKIVLEEMKKHGVKSDNLKFMPMVHLNKNLVKLCAEYGFYDIGHELHRDHPLDSDMREKMYASFYSFAEDFAPHSSSAPAPQNWD